MTVANARLSLAAKGLGVVGAAASALMTVLLAIWVIGDPSAQSRTWLVLAPIGAAVAVVGVWAWWQRRWVLAAVGMWIAACAGIAWFTAVILPLTMAIIATGLAVKDRERRTP